MIHADEVLPFPAKEMVRKKKYASDLNGLITSYEELRDQADQDAAELEALRNELRTLKTDSVQLRSDLHAARTEVERLKAALIKLRRSSNLRVGKAVMLPARGVRKAMRELRDFRGTGDTGASADTLPVLQPSAASLLQRRDLEHKTYEEHCALAAAEPSAGNVFRAVSFGYFVLGDIRGPAKLIRQNEMVVSQLNSQDQAIVRTILGLERLLDRPPFISPKQPNPGYLAERGRIMYCAHSTGHFNSNGYSTRTAELARGLQTEGLDVLVAARPGYPWDVPTDQAKPAGERFTKSILGVDHVFNPGPNWTRQPLDEYWLEATDSYVREAQRARVSAIHSASNYVTGLPALAAARRLGVPFSYEVRGLWEVTEASAKPSWEASERYEFAVRMETLVAVHADIVFAITEQVRDELIRRGVEPERIRLLPNGVDTDRFTPMPPSEAVRAHLNIPAGVPVVGYAGSLVHYEGLSDLLKALKILKDDSVDFRTVIVGDGPELGNLRTEATRLGLTDLVQFTGRIGALDIPKYVSLFDIMPCPRTSLPVTELVSPLKPLEAMASGRAMVLTDLAPLRVFAGPEEERALLALPSNPESLAKSLRLLLGDPILREEKGRRARLWAVENRQWKLIGQEAGRELRKAMEQSSRQAPQGQQMKGLTVGIIADTFTTEGLRGEAELCELLPETWRQQAEETPLDVLFVESAWEGLNGQWRQKVGYYDDERFSALRELLEFCNSRSIPTVFWNKEDPVHFNRFKRSAALFDHVFTTDATCIRKYAEVRGPRVQTIASLPFYAQPRLHNPLPPELDYSHTVAYAGSFYGKRYPERSAELDSLLQAGETHGLTIYDRQYLNPDSPYKFPPNLQKFVQGGLPYLEMMHAYKAHPVHVNVNSVESSPTMFSRRVTELAASGTAVASGRGQGVERVMAGLIQTVSNREETDVLLDRWMTDERARLHDSWLAYRLIHRSHTAAHRLAYVLRCAGLVVRAPEPARYALKVEHLSHEILRSIQAQTVWPAAVIFSSAEKGIDSPLNVIHQEQATPEVLAGLGVQWVGDYPGSRDRTLFEDLLTGATYGSWSEISESSEDLDTPGLGLVRVVAAGTETPCLQSLSWPEQSRGAGIVFRRDVPSPGNHEPKLMVSATENLKRVLVAGHDLKFAGEIIRALETAGHTVAVDQWQGHNQHNEQLSKQLLEEADIIFCEWTLGNAAWYSQHLRQGQRLVTRLHSQELFTNHLSDLKVSRVQRIIFVGQHTANLAVRDHGIPRGKAVVIPNPVDVEHLALDKEGKSRFNLGMVGIVPAQKHLDRALDLLAGLRRHDDRYQLFIKGKRPEDYPWMANRPEEMSFYQEQYLRISSDPLLAGAVHFDAHGDDMPQWYRKIGVVLSVSDFESFHLTLADGAASAAAAVSLDWPGADQIYPASWIKTSVAEMVDYVLACTVTEAQWRKSGTAAREIVAERFDASLILSKIVRTILGAEEDHV